MPATIHNALRRLQRAIARGEAALAVLESATVEEQQQALAAWAPTAQDARYARELARRFRRLRRLAERQWCNGARWEKELRGVGIDARLQPPARIGAAVRRICGIR